MQLIIILNKKVRILKKNILKSDQEKLKSVENDYKKLLFKNAFLKNKIKSPEAPKPKTKQCESKI